MAFSTPHINEQELVNEFTTRVRNHVQNNTQWVGTTAVWNTQVRHIVGSNNSTTQDGPSAGAFKPDVVALESRANSIRKILKDWMAVYSSANRIRLQNTGNSGASNYYGVYRHDTGTRQNATMISQANAAIDASGIASNAQIKRSDIDALITQLQNIWTTYCGPSAGVSHTFTYHYCHGSCHSSRSRR